MFNRSIDSSNDPFPDELLWALRYFEGGKKIRREDFAEVTRVFLGELLKPVFVDIYTRSHPSASVPAADWWQGLNAIARIWSKSIDSRVCWSRLPTALLSYEDWKLQTHAGLTRILGAPEHDDPDDLGFLASWTRNTDFLDAWRDAISAPREGKLRGMCILAIGWDANGIPLRYFSDRAAVALMKHWGLKKAPQELNIKTYQEHWRGPRGLGLSRIRKDTIVDLTDDAHETKFRISKENALRLGWPVSSEMYCDSETGRTLTFVVG